MSVQFLQRGQARGFLVPTCGCLLDDVPGGRAYFVPGATWPGWAGTAACAFSAACVFWAA